MGKASRKSRNRQARTAARRTPTQWGFDYGLSANAVALSSIDFNNNLDAADIIGVAYGLNYSTDLEMQIPTISLVARNEEPLRLAFEEFSHWAEWSDEDAVDLTFVFLRNGAYKLCVGPEARALIHRALCYDSVISPISLQISWIKPIDTTSQPLKDLRAHLARGVRPIMLAAATYVGIALPGKPPFPDLLRPVQHGKELIKFDVRFIDEGSDTDRQWQRIALGPGKGTGKPKHRSPPPRPSKLMVWNGRLDRLKTLFPVSLWRSQASEPCAAAWRAAEQSGLLPWQVDQALCNLVVSREIGTGAPHFEDVAKADWPRILIERLQGRFEIADGAWDGGLQITADALVRQARLDARVLLKAYGYIRIETRLEDMQNQLRKAELLNPSSE